MLILAIMAGLLSVPVAVLLVEVIAALKAPRLQPFEVQDVNIGKRVAVIVPAHNESLGLVPTLQDIKAQLGVGDRLVVVADNCTDDTAAVAGAAGAEVIVRNDPERIGKGFAMGWGITHLRQNPPDFVLFVDADCRLDVDLIEGLKRACQQVQRPVQALFLMRSAENSPVNHSFAEFAWILRNWIRPVGLRNLHCPVQLMGTGMMFPWNAINSVPLASSHLVEDLKLGLDLAKAGQAPYFFPFVKVTSVFPTSAKGTESQRQRWVQGHLATIGKFVPRLLTVGFDARRLERHCAGARSVGAAAIASGAIDRRDDGPDFVGCAAWRAVAAKPDRGRQSRRICFICSCGLAEIRARGFSRA